MLRSDMRRRLTATPVVTLAAVLALTGCSSVPDALNPVEWYESTTDTVGGWFSDDEPQATAPADTAATDGKDFPNLASVPERPTPSTTAEERAKIQQGLVADRDNARYTDSADASAPADPPKPRAATQTASVPAAAPASSAPTPSVAAPKASAASPVSTPVTAPKIANAPPPPPRVEPSSEHSSLWPRRPAPPRESGTPLTSGKVSDSHSTFVHTPPSQAQPATPQARPQANAAPAASGTSLDSAGNGNTRVPSSEAGGPQVTRTLVSTTKTKTMSDGQIKTETVDHGAAAPAQPAVARPAAEQMAAAAPLPAGGDNASDQSPSVIVDSPSLDQYQLGFSGPAYLVGTVNFGHGSAGLSADDRDMIRSIASAAQETDAFIRIIGHASARTAEMELPDHELVNFQTSLARAQAVASALISDGVPQDRVLVEAMSASQPLFFESMPSGEAGNRRAEILFQY
ncbi:MAG: OmpA family protein [Thalassobaculaceae bacterium]|nr:OmpA family protein [Thalassobaculaceae bacterium]